MPRRPGIFRSALPWLFALALVTLVGNRLHVALRASEADLVAHAETLRLGDLAAEVPKDPIGALHILDPLLERQPTHFEARLAAARAWGDLRSYGKAVEQLEIAAETALNVALACVAKRLAVHYLIMADRYDDAVAVAQEVVDLQPGNALPQLQLGAALYKGSVASQSDVSALFVGLDKGDREVGVELAIETYVTDLWSAPSVEPLVDRLAPDADSSFRDELRVQLLAARRRFLESSEVMADYPNYSGFDVQLAQAYTEMLLRSGRVFQAHLECSLALRRDDIPTPSKRVLLETQARCSLVMQEYGLAADAYERIVEDFVADMGWCPPRFPAALIEYRLADQDWAWFDRRKAFMQRTLGKDIWWGYALARKAFAAGDTETALKEIVDPFAVISLGTLLPFSVRGDPARRRDVLMLAHDIFAAVGDSRSLSALDALLEDFPTQLVARRMRADILRSQGYLEGAMDDAFRLLRSDRRDLEDFDLWLTIADELSRTRHGAGLAERAVARVEDEASLRQASLAAVFQQSQVRQRKGARELRETTTSAFPSQDPALAFEVIRERVRRNELERARNDGRQLVQAHPQVQEFRFRVARLLVREGKLESAAEDFREILAHVPSDTETLDLAMRVEIAMGHDAAAANLVNEMILADPLGVGAVRYAQLLLEQQNPQRAERLIERLVALDEEPPGIDVLTMVARAQLAQGEFEAAGAVLENLHAHYPLSSEVALLGLELGLAQDHEGLIDAAVKALRPLSAGLFPDEVLRVGAQLLAARRFDELLTLFPEDQRQLKALVPALRPLAEAAKAVGQVDEAGRLLSLADDADALRDRFLLYSLAGRTEEICRDLRLSPVASSERQEFDLCLLAGVALGGAPALIDEIPTGRLRDLGLGQEVDSRQLELLDACLRLLAAVNRPETVIPPQVSAKPLSVYPRAGPQVARLVALARKDPEAARAALTSLVHMLLAGDRPFWLRETRQLAEHVLELLPGLEEPSMLLSQRRLEQDRPRDALSLLRQVLAGGELDLRALALFIEASHAFEREEWGWALGLLHADSRPDVTLLLAQELLKTGRPGEALPFFQGLIDRREEQAGALAGLVAAASMQRDEALVLSSCKLALELHPNDSELAGVCTEAMASLRSPGPEAVAVMEQMALARPDDERLLEALARSWSGDGARAEPILRAMIVAMNRDPVELKTPAAASRTLMLMSAAGTARRSGLSTLARELNGMALRLEPGNVLLYRELAFLELEEGHLDTARSYLEVLAFVDRADKEAPLALARLLFEQVGQPHLASEVVKRAWPHSMPPLAVEILSAESYLRGNINDALSRFHVLRDNPLVTPDTVLDLAKMALAAGVDDGAAATFDIFLMQAAKSHPARARAEALRASCRLSAPVASTAPTEG